MDIPRNCRRLGLGFLLVLVGLFMAWAYSRFVPGPQNLAAQLMALGHWREVGFIGAHVVATALAVPGTVLVVAGGVLFGVAWGTF